MSLNIQSGWNLGGPVVKPDDAAKKLVWSEARVEGPTNWVQHLPEPKRRDGYYRDLFVVAYRLKSNPAAQEQFAGITASSAQSGHPAKDAIDGDTESFWVSGGTNSGQGPTKQHPEWLQLNFKEPIAVHALTVRGRPSYGPHDCELQMSNDGKTFQSVKSFTVSEKEETQLSFPPVQAKAFRLLVFTSFDPRSPEQPRNVQIAHWQLSGPTGVWPAGVPLHRPIQNWQEKALLRTLHFSAPDTTPLLTELPSVPGEEDTHKADVIDLTAKLDRDGVLHWDVPEGAWQILRFGCTIGDRSYVSTSSDGWKGYALDVLDAGAFERYWNAVMEPLLADAGPLAGTTLKYLHTDSWEVEGFNWTPTLRAEFQKRRGYDLLPFLPVIAGPASWTAVQ